MEPERADSGIHLMDEFQTKAVSAYLLGHRPEPPHQILFVTHDALDISQYHCWCEFVALDPHDAHFTQHATGYHYPLADPNDDPQDEL